MWCWLSGPGSGFCVGGWRGGQRVIVVVVVVIVVVVGGSRNGLWGHNRGGRRSWVVVTVY